MATPHILIVEDETSIAENIIYALETENFQTSHLTEGGSVANFIQDNDIQLIILDVGLPDILGFDVCKTVRAFSNVPILFLTARSSEIDHVLGLELGADDYVTKPFSPRALTARVRAILRRTSEAPVEDADSNSLLYHDAEKMSITCIDQPLDLTAHEYKLLAAFLEQPGRTFSREQLLDKAWDDPCAAMDRTIDAHIKTLRAKLNKASPRCGDIIQTRRGLGYALHLPDES